MGERHERIFLLAVQDIFLSHPAIASKLLRAFGSARAIFEASHADLRPYFERFSRLWGKFLYYDSWQRAEVSLDQIEKIGASIITILDDSYPPLLREIYDAPPVLLARGAGADFQRVPAVAIVGSRKATSHGLDIAAELGLGLAQEGFTVVSGMAYGIDAAAHRGALAGGGRTVAVMGCGPDIVYPPSHHGLSEAIRESGMILSEFPTGYGPLPENFPQRNRIISGLSIATVIVEAEARSGSLITARFALEQNREVMAVPGPAGRSLARGVNRLIKDGAMLVESAEEVAHALQPLVRTMGFPERSGHLKNDVDKDSQILGAMTARRAIGLDELAAKTGLSIKDLSLGIANLTMSGAIEERPGRRWRLKETDAKRASDSGVARQGEDHKEISR